ncbi:hypothetical protein HDV00_011759 [Rhizophlyctis rosea]|nr:hypothetical protein HDV00_011759 [Rhizophlyctis rosea]
MVSTAGGYCQSTYWDTDDFGHSPCCAKKDAGNPSATTYQRGQSVGMQWKRMNHAAGFVQLSVAKFENSDSMEEFAGNVFHLNCHEQGCMSGEACPTLTGTTPCNEPFGGDNDCRPSLCSQSFTIPTWLPDGQYTILWTWFGSGGYGGDKYAGQSDYNQCLDFTVSGGDEYKAKASGFCPTFKGGDVHTNGDGSQCFYHGSGNQVGMCKEAPCAGSYQGGKPGGFGGCF